MARRQAEIDVKGLKAYDRALGRADKTLRKELRGKLLDAARIAVTEAKAIAESKGLRESGDLIRGIRPFARTGSAGVRSGATHGGYPYPKRLEYEGRGAGGIGPGAHVNPAIAAKEEEIYDRIATLLDDVERDFGGPSL